MSEQRYPMRQSMVIELTEMYRKSVLEVEKINKLKKLPKEAKNIRRLDLNGKTPKEVIREFYEKLKN
jgi:hypothetical protein